MKLIKINHHQSTPHDTDDTEEEVTEVKGQDQPAMVVETL